MTPKRKRVATIRDVAQAAGVSTATVSKFVNGGQRFTADVEARVSKAVKSGHDQRSRAGAGAIDASQAARVQAPKKKRTPSPESA